MARWIAGDVPEWITAVVFLLGLPVVMVILQMLLHRRLPEWRRGDNNDVAGIMLSAAVVVYSVAVGLCVVTLWGKLDEARKATESEATNMVALAGGTGVFGLDVQQRIRGEVLKYNQDVVDHWSGLVKGETADPVRLDLGALVKTVGDLKPQTEAQRAYVDDAVGRLSDAAEFRATTVRLSRDQQLPDVLWIAVLGGSVIVLALSMTCGVRDRAMRGILLAGVTATVGINLFLVAELNYPFLGDIAIGPDSYLDVITTLQNMP